MYEDLNIGRKIEKWGFIKEQLSGETYKKATLEDKVATLTAILGLNVIDMKDIFVLIQKMGLCNTDTSITDEFINWENKYKQRNKLTVQDSLEGLKDIIKILSTDKFDKSSLISQTAILKVLVIKLLETNYLIMNYLITTDYVIREQKE